jgi:hypothetical protein
MSYKPWKNSEDLIESVKRKIAFPLSQNTFSEEDILHFANEEMMLSMVPQILSFHEEFFVYKEKYPLVMNKFNYPIPPRAIGMKLKDVFYEDGVGNVFEMTRIDPANKDYYQNDTANQNNYKYYYENNDIVLAKTSVTPIIGYMRVEYFLRPNQLVMIDRAATLTDILRPNDTDVYVKFDAVPEHIINNSKIDFLQTESGHKLYTKDVIMPAIESTGNIGYYKFTPTDIPSDVVIGDYMCAQYECIIPQAPDDLHSGLAERVCSRILASLGDKDGLKASNEKVKDIEYRQGNLIDNRTEAQTQKIVGRHTILRYNKARYRRY